MKEIRKFNIERDYSNQELTFIENDGVWREVKNGLCHLCSCYHPHKPPKTSCPSNHRTECYGGREGYYVERVTNDGV